jgi:3',5'-cyclic AMP phosphodiesterase CpdA
MLFAQISDMHIQAPGQKAYEILDTAEHLRRCVAHLNALDPTPELVFATGDLVHSGAPEEYDNLRELLQPLTMPCYLLTGNHDDRSEMRRTFPEHSYLPADGEFLHYTVDYAMEDGPLRFIALDTLIPGKGGGRMCDERLGWLSGQLADAPDRPTVILMHHPPIQTGIAYMDRFGLEGVDDLAGIVARHKNILRILCGHIHRPIQAMWAGTGVQISPSPAHQIMLDLGGDTSNGYLILEPPAYMLHLWHPITGLVSHVSFVGEFEGPRPFRKSMAEKT